MEGKTNAQVLRFAQDDKVIGVVVLSERRDWMAKRKFPPFRKRREMVGQPLGCEGKANAQVLRFAQDDKVIGVAAV